MRMIQLIFPGIFKEACFCFELVALLRIGVFQLRVFELKLTLNLRCTSYHSLFSELLTQSDHTTNSLFPVCGEILFLLILGVHSIHLHAYRLSEASRASLFYLPMKNPRSIIIRVFA